MDLYNWTAQFIDDFNIYENELSPFPGKLPMTKDDVAWRQETYHPENSFWDFGRKWRNENITNDRMIDALNKMK
mgnify:CR=1 FL=1